MKHIKKAMSYSVAGSIGLTVISSLSGCGDQGLPPQDGSGFGSQQELPIDQSYFLVIEQTGAAPDAYRIAEKHPTTGPSRAILRDLSGNERFMSEDELKQLAEQEAAKVEEGTSRLTQDPGMHSGGMSLGETLLAAAAGSLIGSMLANRWMGNRNFQRTQQAYGGGRPTAAISQPYNKTAGNKQARSGFFGRTSGKSSSSGYGSFGG